MPSEFDKPYNPKEHEDKIYKLWEKSGFFAPEARQPRDDNPNKNKSFTIALPPPNVTGSLHMGHALNATIQDILIRKKRMEGYRALWIPGTDHAGIATQNVVEKELKKQGISRHDLGREKFLEKVWEWKEKYGNIILDQLKKLGASCDWSRARFTMDPEYQEAVKMAFLHYQKKGWIYHGERVINWCARCRTSLSDLELEHEEEKGKLWFIRYPLKEAPTPALPSGRQGRSDNFVVVATTRPETMLGDSAVAVNPKDKRYKNLVGKIAILPIQNRKIPIISDRRIEMDFGTGAVKITPAHDMLDEQIGLDHKLAAPKIIGEDGRMTKEAGKDFTGLKILEAREKVLERLGKLDLIEKTEDYTHNVAQCYRCVSTIEPLRSEQWFLKMSKLAKLAIRDVKSGKIKFHPKRWEKVYFDWLNPPVGGLKDWCISRQIWWGHKIPIEGVDDVLDTWFSSALWPFATLGWPEKTRDLETYYPTQVLSTARDIINLWVARMVFSSGEFLSKPPFSDVIIHATILAKDGRRMSKSLGTGVDPMNLIEKYGADATRFGLVWQAMGGQDIHWAEEHVVAGKKFCNKIWNAARFVLQNKNLKANKKNSADKKILAQLKKTQKNVSRLIEKYDFGRALHILYEFFWHDYCDIYLEESKKNPNPEILSRVLKESLKLLHPFMPFVTERIWREFSESGNLLMIEPWKS
ncbi:MAG: valine--tRNA ligase [Candidatus Giovannonibacteria bacterium]|nr:MAG: valine--tRNA ligase [Candidatus Giovannonibacteria bacterium]